MELPAGVSEAAFVVRAGTDPETATYAEISARVTGPDGTVVVPCFWDGVSAWRARFRSPAPGTYQVEPIGLDGVSAATVEVSRSDETGSQPALARAGRRLATSDGEPFLWLADTWWYALCDRAPDLASFEALLARRRSQGYTVIQLVAGLFPEVDAFDPLGDLAGCWPWSDGFEAIEPRWWDAADERMTAVVQAGLVPAVAGAWSYYMLDMGPRRIEAHWRQIVARWGAFPVVWCVAGEAGLPHYDQLGEDDIDATVASLSAAWRAQTRRVREIDGYSNLRTIHPCPAFAHFSSTDVIGDVSDLDLIWLQTGHADRAAIESSLSTLDREVAAPHGLPVVNSEVCYEGIASGSAATLQRFLFWSHLLSGAAGHTYGAQGLWAFRRAEDPGPGIAWGDATWQEAVELPGAAQLGSGAEILRSLPSWESLSRAPGSLSLHASPDQRVFPYAATADGLRVAYFPAASLLPLGIGISLDLNEVWLEDLEAGEWEVTFWDPRKGRQVQRSVVVPDQAGRWLLKADQRETSLPSMEDWVLIASRIGES